MLVKYITDPHTRANQKALWKLFKLFLKIVYGLQNFCAPTTNLLYYTCKNIQTGTSLRN